MTTENVAILFTDIVRSTELSQRLSQELADEVRRNHFSVLRQAIAEAGGTEVKNLGDGLMVVFSSASAALACGVAMQQGVEQGNRGAGHGVGLRVGLSGGEVSREDDDYFGDPVVEAARLCARCDSGQVLAADIVRAMAGRRSRIECRSLGNLELKGLPDPVETVEVLWEPLPGAVDGTAVPIPGRLTVRPDVGVVGRSAEAEALAEAGKRVAGGGGREVVLVSGEAGLGKTTLVAEVARTAFDSGALVLFGHCEEDLATPYQLFAEALGHYVTHAPEEQLLAHVEAHGSELARLVPALASRIPDLPPTKATDTDSERFLLFAAAVGLLAMAAAEQPVVLVLDDLQWADKGSLLLLRHLASSDVPMRLLVLGTYRDSELSRSHPFLDTLAALRRQNGVSRIELAGLDDTGVLALMEAAAGHSLNDEAVALAHAVYRETDGNPFFVREVLLNLSETGAIYQDPTGRWVAKSGLERMALPDSVREVIGARVGRLGDRAGRVLSVAAVIGRDFDLELLARSTDSSEDDLLDLLDAASAASLVRELVDTPGRYNFAHALIQHTLYEDLGPTRRARTHRNVAKALEDLCGGRPGSRVGELARHWFNATQPIDLVKAIEYSRQAGDAALAGLAPGDALRYYAQALDLSAQADDVDPSLALDLAIGLGTAQRQAGDPSYRTVLLDAAHRAAQLDDTHRLVRAVLASDRGFFSVSGIDRANVEVLETALERLPDDDLDRALVLAILCQELTYGSSLERRQAIASLQRSAEAMRLADQIGDPVLQFWAVDRRVTIAGCSGDVDEMDRCLAIAGELADRLGQATLQWVQTFQLGCRALIAGDPARAEQLATVSLEFGQASGEPDAELFFGFQLGDITRQRGTAADVLPALEQLLAEVEENSEDLEGTNPHGLQSGMAAIYAEDGRVDDAGRILADVAAMGFDLPMDFVWIYVVANYATAAIAAGDPEYAEPILEMLAPYRDQQSYIDTASHGPVSLLLGGLATVMGRYAEAADYFIQAERFCDRAEAAYFMSLVDLYWGVMLATRQDPGDWEPARERLASSLSAAQSRGYGSVATRASGALRTLG